MMLGEMMLRKGALEKAKEYYAQAEKKGKEVPAPIEMNAFLKCDLAWLATIEKNYLLAVESFLGILRRHHEYQSKFILPVVMARSIPLLEVHSHDRLAARIALVVQNHSPVIQLNTLRPVREFLGKIKTEQGVDAYHEIVEMAGTVPLEKLKTDLEDALREIRVSLQE